MGGGYESAVKEKPDSASESCGQQLSDLDGVERGTFSEVVA
jgi:hypothetical protein